MEDKANLILLFFAMVIAVANPQKVPPGVNPNAYQPPPPQQQQYQPPPPPPQQVQYQQHQPIQSAVPQLPQELPVVQHQQQQQHQPQHQPQPHHQQGHEHHGQPQLLNAANLAEEKEHMQEHLSANIDTSKMNEQELQFHYFKMHDADNNNKLDGCELIKSLIHWHEQGHHDPSTGHQTAPREKIFVDEELTNLIDPILNMDDTDGDGYIDYPEFVKAQQKAAAAAHTDDKEEELVVHTDEDLSLGVDSMLTDMDQNNDGYIDWYEYSSFTMKDNVPEENKDSISENVVI